jgi:hypothetical protein
MAQANHNSGRGNNKQFPPVSLKKTDSSRYGGGIRWPSRPGVHPAGMGRPARRHAPGRWAARAEADAARRGPQAFGSDWPAYIHDWADLLAQQEADEADKDRAHREQNRTRLRPSSIEIARMEQAVCWPARYLPEIPQLVRTKPGVIYGCSVDGRGHYRREDSRVQVPTKE